MTKSSHILLSVCAVCVLLGNAKGSFMEDKILGTWICDQGDGKSRCSLSCLLYPIYFDGYCDKDGICTCIRRPSMQTTRAPSPYGKCASVDGNDKCSVSCLFFSHFQTGFCQNGICMCVPK